LEPAITLEGLKWAARQKFVAPKRRPRRAAKPIKPQISIKRLKKAAGPLLKPKPLEQAPPAWGEVPEPFLERLKREVFNEKKRGGESGGHN
jgi:hypothetical protein